MNNLLTACFLMTSACAVAQSAGSLDPTFGTGGKVVTSVTTGDDKAYGAALQSDGKILVAGFSTSAVTGKDFTCTRYNADGTLDNTFGTGGIVTTDLQPGSDDVAWDIALQADGKIVLAGSSDNGSDKNAAVVRYLANGVIDSTFGTNGIVLTDLDNHYQDELRTVKIHALTGNIIVGGYAQISTNVAKPIVARYLANGVIDSSFNATGIRKLWIGSNDSQYFFSVEDLAVQANGKITFTGWRDFPASSWNADYWAGRINSDGTMDNTFSSDGVSTYNGGFNGNDKAYAMLLRSNNNLLVAGAGYISTLAYDFSMFEITAAGPSSGSIGTADFSSSLNDIAYGLAEDVNGKFVLAGSTGTTTNRTFGIARLTSAFAADNTFGTSGKVTTTFGSNLLSECFDVFVQPDNKIVAVGYTGGDIAIARYLGTNVPQLNAFVLETPANGAANQNYATLGLNWSDAFGATGYEVDLADNATFTGAQTYTSAISSRTVTGLQPSTQYWWRVRATDGTVFGDNTAPWSFTTNSLENFTLQTPANNAVNQPINSLAFNWTDAVGAAGYEIEIALSSDFSLSPQSFNVTASAYTLATALQPETDYFWHVRVVNASQTGNWSNTWKFTTLSTVGVDEATATSLLVYPNPGQEFVSVVAPEALVGQAYVLHDNSGKAILSGELAAGMTTIATGALSPGVYFLQAGNAAQPVKWVKH